MLILVVYMVVGALIVLFASQNLELATVYLIIGPPLTVPLIIVIGISFILGYLTAILAVIRRAVKGGSKKPGTQVARR